MATHEPVTPYAHLQADVRSVDPADEGGGPTGLPWGATLDCRVVASSGSVTDVGDATIFFEDRRELDPGETARARILPGFPSRWRDVAAGAEFELRLRDRLLATGSITEVLVPPVEARFAPRHREAAGGRWLAHRNRNIDDPKYREEWRREQCGSCQFWIPLAGSWGLDWGGCSNEASPFDGTVRFEHDGCDQYSEAAHWYGPVEFSEEDFSS